MFLNKYTLIGILLMIVGVILTPIWIGIPILVFGFLIADFGIIYYIIKKIPGAEDKVKDIFKMIKKSYEPYFKKKRGD